MYVCPAGHMSIRKAASSRKSEQKSPRISYYFDTDKCKFCKQRDGCYKEGARLKTYSVLKKSPVLDDRIAFQRTEYFIERVRQRYKIEAKNSELKNAHGYHTAWSVGVNSLKLQGAMAIFVVNLKRILTLIENR